MVHDFARWIYPILDRHRRMVVLGAYGGVTAVAYLLAFVLRFEFRLPSAYVSTFLASLPVLVVVRLVVNRAFKLSTGRWRFVGTRDATRLVGAMFVGSAVFSLAAVALPLSPRVPHSVLLIEWVLTTYLTAGLWLGYRTAFERLRHQRSGINGSAKRVVIIGAGEAGNMLAREMDRFPTGYRPIGFVDDDPRKRGTYLHGLKVLGSTTELPRVVSALDADEIIIALPSAPPERLRYIVDLCEAAGLPFKVLPGIAEVLEGDVGLHQIREVRIEDLLGRDPVQLDLPELAEDLRGRSILITGAAGSIGSELARQVALHQPGTLVVLDQAESDLYYLELDLRERHPDLHLVPIIGDIVVPGTVERVFSEYAPERVFHAAAYKHVPLMESNLGEAVGNNVVGTWRVADAAGRYGAAKFVLVSTDKAVRPVSVMGATKRLAEMVVIALQDRYPETSYSAVRFGNVLGSKGSVIPLFERQLKAGRPLTVTHPEASRYFMTIPEAVQLILQASLLPDLHGRIAMLEMGEPVRILELAKNLIRLSGLTGRPTDRIVITGLRPGERLHEELVAPDEETVSTSIPKVHLVVSHSHGLADLLCCVPEWEQALHEGRAEVVASAIKSIFPSILSDTIEASPLVFSASQTNS